MNDEPEDKRAPNVVDFQGKPDELKAAVESLMRNLPTLIEHAAIKAIYKRQYYLMLCAQGFTSQQAIELAKESSPL